MSPVQDDDTARHLLTMSTGFPTPAKVEQGFTRYRDEPGWSLLAHAVDGQVTGVIGLQHMAPGEAVIQAIAVLPSHRGQGIGRQMVRQVWARFGLRRLTAETDKDSVEFHRPCGFAITSLGEKYPGIERFACELIVTRSAEPSDPR